MLERCAWHIKYFGIVLYPGTKEPLEDKSITDTICPQCEAILWFEDSVGKMEYEIDRLMIVQKELYD